VFLDFFCSDNKLAKMGNLYLIWWSATSAASILLTIAFTVKVLMLVLSAKTSSTSVEISAKAVVYNLRGALIAIMTDASSAKKTSLSLSTG
jgi:hypothetical protein